MKWFNCLLVLCIGLVPNLNAQQSLSGVISYAGPQHMGIEGCLLCLKDSSGNRYQALSGPGGAFSMDSILPGEYHISIHLPYPWEGVDSSDMDSIMDDFLERNILTGIRRYAADVNGNGYLNAVDALLLALRHDGAIDTFMINDVLCDSPAVKIQSGENTNISIQVLWAGDINGSCDPNQAPWMCGDSLVDLRDGQVYGTIQMGSQCWMQENLNVGVLVTSNHTGYSHSDVSDNGIIEKYCYGNDPVNCLEYGGLYDWNEAMGYQGITGRQGICPQGWHLPANSDWCILTSWLDPSVNCTNPGWTGTDAGAKMKETGYAHWSPLNVYATNSSGFTAVGGGYRSYLGDFNSLKHSAVFLSSNEATAITASTLYLSASNSNISRVFYSKSQGVSVRCIKD